LNVITPPVGRTSAFIVVLAGHVAVAVLLLSARGPRVLHAAAVALQVSIVEAPRATEMSVPGPVPTLIVPVLTAPLPELRIAISMATVAPPPVAVSAQTPEPPPVVIGEPDRGDYVVSQADYMKRPALRYPQLAQKQRQRGTVLLRVTVGLDGHPQQVRVERSSGYPLLDRAAQDAVRDALFRPFVVGGSARVAEVIVPIEFLLRAG